MSASELGALLDAATRGDVEAVVAILDRAPALIDQCSELPGNHGRLARGADVNVRDDTGTGIAGAGGYTALHAAAFHGNEPVVRALLKRGADVTARDTWHCDTPAGWADYAGHRDIRDVILRGAIDIFDALDFDVTERIPQLLKTDRAALDRSFGAYGNGKCEKGRARWMTPLAQAVVTNNVEATKYLLEEGAALTVTPDGRTLQDVASEKGREDVARILREHREGPVRPVRGSHEERVAWFLEFACWDHTTHGQGDHRLCDCAAQRLLAHYPEIARDSLYTAIVCGDLDEVTRILAERPDAARQRGGARFWTPILYLTYARFSHPPAVDNAVAIARLLLAHGADPNDYYMAGHSRYATLVGVAREGEQDAPPHPRREELFELLIEHGARMYDAQVLYNTHFHGDLLWWLKLLYARAERIGRLEDWRDPDWAMLDMGGYGPGALFILGIAVEKDDRALAAWALAHGASPNAVNPTHPRFNPTRTLYAEAVRRGHREIAELLRQHGANTDIAPLEGEDAFIEACLQLDRESARRHLDEHPEYRSSPRPIFEAARRDRVDVVEFLLDLGVPVDIANKNNERPLHHAAFKNALRVARLLIARGAEIDPPDNTYHSPPIGWAAHGDHDEMVAFLSQYSRDVWRLAFRGYVDRLRDVLRDNPSLATLTSADGITPLWWLPDDEEKALAVVELLLAHGANPAARSTRGTTAADWARKRGMLTVVQRLTAAGG